MSNNRNKINLTRKYNNWFNSFSKPYEYYGQILKDIFIIPIALALLVVPIVGFCFYLTLFVIFVISDAIRFPFLLLRNFVANEAILKDVDKLEIIKHIKDYMFFADTLKYGVALGCTYLVLSPLILIKIPMRLYHLAKEGWSPVWENRTIKRDVTEYNQAVAEKNTVRVEECKNKIQEKLIKSYRRQIVGANLYMQLKANDDGKTVVSNSPPDLVLKENSLDETIKKLSHKISL
jgi:hypothetical protein